MSPDLIGLTLYAIILGLVVLKYSYKYRFHHWMVGLIAIFSVVPVIIINSYKPNDYYTSLIFTSFILGITSFAMDFHDFKDWWFKNVSKKRRKKYKSRK